MREARIGEVVAAVARQALADWGVRRIALLDDASPEAALAGRFLERLGPEVLVRVPTSGPGVEPLLHALGRLPEEARVGREVAGLRARLEPDALPAAPDNKTALLLDGALPPEPFLPLGDLWASEVAELAGGWSAPAGVRALAEAAGGIDRLDAALRARVDRRDPTGLDGLPGGVAEEVRRRFALGRASRLAVRLVPKVGSRTLGLDLFE
ncbi:MAG TPA: hypothetical protein VHG28_07510 [Longimicrobiaceae bacterium]|nr:hypothetical protein [Longimicrobiaceae bacterium]